MISSIVIWWWELWSKENENGYYVNKEGYLIHRKVALNYIYNRAKIHEYPLPFTNYVIHHVNYNKKDNSIRNLRILTVEEHNHIHRR